MDYNRSLHYCPLVAVALVGILGGCHKPPKVVVAPPKPVAPAQVDRATIAQFKPNEAGAVMILMYHNFDATKPNGDYNRQPNTFRQDLDALYKRGYRPVTASEFIHNQIAADVPAGKTPVVLTFDDSLPTQFRTIAKPDGHQAIDPDCAVGIMETFHKQHPDWGRRGTFFVLPPENNKPVPFYQQESLGRKFTYLLKAGYEIQNHTSTHPHMRGMDAAKVRWELATAKRDIQGIDPTAAMDIMAIPYGEVPKAPDARDALIAGADGGTSYRNHAVFLAAYRPVLSAITKKDKKVTQGGRLAVFDPYRLERIKPNPTQANLPGTFEYWLKWFDANPFERYVSGGNPQVAVVPDGLKSTVDPARVQKLGQVLQVYGGANDTGGKGAAPGAGGGSDGELSVN